MNNRSIILFRATLLILLFTVQGLCHAHTVEHITTGDSSICAVCSAGCQLDSAAVDVSITSTVKFAAISIPVFRAPAVTTLTCSVHEARAPPLSR